MSGQDQRAADFLRILRNLREALEVSPMDRTTRDRDSAILRFELAFEVCWKLLQQRVRTEGLESNGPRQALEQAFSLGWIEDESVWHDLLRDRNLAVQVYREEWAEDLFRRLPDYLLAFERLTLALGLKPA